jgi:cell division protein FtsA
MKNNIIAGLDIGTTKVCAVIAEEINGIRVVKGTGVVPSDGMSNGMISNISKMSNAIREAVKIASREAEVNVSEVNIGIAGEHIRSFRHRHFTTITNPEGEVRQEDLDRLKNDVRKLKSSSELQILHIIPEQYFLDDKEVQNPIDMLGTKLEAVHHVVLASVPAIANIERAVEKAGYKVKDRILQPLASSIAVLDENEKDLGVALIDIGGGTTDVAVFKNGVIKFSGVVGTAGNAVTNAIRETFSVVSSEAEQIKVNFGYAHQSAIIKPETIMLKGVGARKNRTVDISLICQVINLQMKRIFEMINHQLEQSKIKDKLHAGIVITGGGAMLRGITELAGEVFGIPAKIGLPMNIANDTDKEISKPEFATALGLVEKGKGVSGEPLVSKKNRIKRDGPLKKILKKLIEIFNEL